MPTVIVQDLNNVWVDGVNAGLLVDVLRNHPQAASDVTAALSEWRQSGNAPPRHAHAVFLSSTAAACREFSEALTVAGTIARTFQTLRLGETLQLSDFTGPLAGLTPAHAAVVMGFIDAINKLADTKPQGSPITFREAIVPFAVAATPATPAR